MNAPLYNAEILRLAATIPHHDRLPDPMGSSEKRSPVCGSRVTVDINVDDQGRVSEVGLLVRACALGQASSSLMGASVIGKSPEELAAARDALTALAGGRGPLPDWPGFELFTPALPHSARHASIRLALRGCRRGCRSRPRQAPTHDRDPLLFDAVVLLGFGLVFVLIFRRFGLGATAWLSRRGRSGRAAGARPGRRCRIEDRRRRARHHPAAVHRRARAQSAAAVAAEERDFRARPDAGRAVRHRGIGRGVAHHAILARGRAGARPAARAVLDRAGAADAAIGRAPAHPVRRARLLDPAVPGPVDRPADHHRRGDVAQSGRRRGAAGLAAVCLHRAGGGRAGADRALCAAPAVPDSSAIWASARCSCSPACSPSSPPPR